MKLRFRKNSLRLRMTQGEVKALANGTSLEEAVYFPGDRVLRYDVHTVNDTVALATFERDTIRIQVPAPQLRAWASSDEIGLYYEFPTQAGPLRLAVEKDLECLDGPAEEREPDAFPRQLAGKNC